MNIENPQQLVQGGEYIIYENLLNSHIRSKYLGVNNEFGNNIFVFKPTDRRMESLLKIPENRMNQYQILLPDNSDPNVFIGYKKLMGPPRRLLSDIKVRATDENDDDDDDAMEIGGRRKSRRRRRTKRYRKKRSTRRKRAKK